jgi:serine/threonine protein kinase
MNWIKKGQFRLVTNRPGKHYAFRRNNSGNAEYNIPTNITTKKQAISYLLAKGNGLKPSRGKGVRKVVPFPVLPLNWKPPIVRSPSGSTRERRAYNLYIAKKRLGNGSPKYGPGSPTLKRLYKAAIRSEGHKVSPNTPMAMAKFSCSSKRDLGARLGSGKQGVVFKLGNKYAAKVSPKDLRASKRKEPQPSLVEFTNQKKAYAAAPEGVVAVYDIAHCLDFVSGSNLNMNNSMYDKSKQSIIFMEYCSGGSFESLLKKGTISDDKLMSEIFRVLNTLKKIMKKYPDFRHNDLWTANVFMSNRGALIGDFGWSRVEKNGTNPAVNTANGTNTAGKWGVGPSTNARYDTHLFLNDLRGVLSRNGKGKYPKTAAFLNWAVPPGYRGFTDVHVNEMRLKYKDPCPGLMTLSQILSYKSGRPITPNLLAAKAKLKKVRGPLPRVKSMNLMVARAKLKKAKKPNAKPPNKKPNATARAATRANIGVVARKKVNIPRAILKSNAFNRLVEKIRTSQSPKKVITSQGTYVNEGYNNARNRARTKAMNQVENRINRGQDPFSNSPLRPKAKSPPKVKSPPKKLAPLVKPAHHPLFKGRVVPAKKARAVFINTPVNNKYRRSPKSGRMKMKANSGRFVYVNLHMSLADLKKLAGNKRKNITGIKTKADIIRKIFS